MVSPPYCGRRERRSLVRTFSEGLLPFEIDAYKAETTGGLQRMESAI
jgi:hypothetical protein